LKRLCPNAIIPTVELRNLEEMTVRSLILALALSFVSICAWAADAPATPAPAPAPAEPVAAEPVPDTPLVNPDLLAAALKTYFTAEDEPLAETPTTAAPQTLTVDQAVTMALEKNPQVAIAESQTRAAEARIGQARAQLRPQVGGTAGARYSDNSSSFNIGGPLGGRFVKKFAGNLAGDDIVTTESVTVDQVLFAGGQIRAAIRASEYLAKSQEWQKQATLDQLAYNVREAYYNVLLARALERVALESVQTFERHAADAQRMFDVGLISGFEVLRARTELGTRKADATAAANGVRLAKANLRRTLALPPDTPVRLVGSMDLNPVTTPVGELVAQARQQRPELLALEQGIQAAEQGVARARGQYWPRVAASAGYSNIDGGPSIASTDGFSATVGAQVNLYAGGRRKYEVAEANEEVNRIRSQYADVNNLVELDVTQANIQLQDAAARVQAELGNVELAREGLRLAELRFQEGVGTQTETLDASLALTSAESALARALNSYAVAYASLQRALGGPTQPTVEAKKP
jgi:outer membrane protein TolC